MSKWTIENHQGIKVYYSSDVIEKIKSLVQEDICKTCPYDACLKSNSYPCTEKQILDIIESEDKNENKYCL